MRLDTLLIWRYHELNFFALRDYLLAQFLHHIGIIHAALTLTKLSAQNPVLEAFAIVLLTIWFLASAAFLMLKTCGFSGSYLRGKCIWVAFLNTLNCHLALILKLKFIQTASALALVSTDKSGWKAITIELQASWLGARAWFLGFRNYEFFLLVSDDNFLLFNCFFLSLSGRESQNDVTLATSLWFLFLRLLCNKPLLFSFDLFWFLLGGTLL